MPSEFAVRQKHDLIRDISALGSMIFCIIILLIFLATKNYYLLRQWIAGLAVVYIIVILIRTFYFKHRPVQLPHTSYIERLDASSFPSLHAARSTLLCSILIGYFGSPYFTILAVLAAAAETLGCTRA